MVKGKCRYVQRLGAWCQDQSVIGQIFSVAVAFVHGDPSGALHPGTAHHTGDVVVLEKSEDSLALAGNDPGFAFLKFLHVHGNRSIKIYSKGIQMVAGQVLICGGFKYF